MWTELHACQKKTHCLACRTDADWRQSLVNAGLVETRDFACPNGIDKSTAQAVQDEAMAKLRPDTMTREEYDALKAEERRRRQLVGGCCGNYD